MAGSKMTDKTRSTTAQSKDAPASHSYKLEQINSISSLAQGHVYAMKYFPEDLQALLNITSLKYDERAPGYIGAILGWSKDPGEGYQYLPIPSNTVEILWDIKNRKVVLRNQSPPSTTEWQSAFINSGEALPRLQLGWKFVPPYSTILTTVDRENIILLDVFFRYCLLVQGYDDALEGFKYSFWVWFEKLCRHIAEQALTAEPSQDDDASKSTKTEPPKPICVQDAELEGLCSQGDTAENAHEDKITALDAREEKLDATSKSTDEELVMTQKEVEKWKKTYEDQSKAVEEERSSSRMWQAACEASEAKLRQRDWEVGEWKKRYEALRKETRKD